MTRGYLDAERLREALGVFVAGLVEEARRRGLRASAGGVLSGMGFDYLAPHIMAQGLYSRGLIVDKDGSLELSPEGLEYVRLVVEGAAMIRDWAGFPEQDGGRLVGAVAYAMYDWSNERRDARELLSYALRIREELGKLGEDPELFKLAALLLPRMYYEGGYTPLKLFDAIRRAYRGRTRDPQGPG